MPKRPNMRTLQMQDTIDRQKRELESVRSNLPGFYWRLTRARDGTLAIILLSPTHKIAATVFLVADALGRFVWFVWDENGVGVENDAAGRIPLAMKEAEMAAERWGKHGLICNCGSELNGSHDHVTCGPPVPRE